ncbi:MAG: nucleotidyltransferase family protein [Halioglobus sp.]|nr:nucleotidyltransferase family protein [Halioglobus sp.]
MKIRSAWPNAVQKLLLKAAIFPQDDAERYWHTFLQQHDLQHLDHGCNQILPMVYINLKDRLSNDTDKWTCKSAYKHVWASNHILMFDLKNLLLQLKRENIRVCLLKGAAYIGHYFPDYGMRTMGDIDILVSPADIEKLNNCLESNGYNVSSNYTGADARGLQQVFKATPFVNARGTEIDAHQYLSTYVGDPTFNEILWATSHPIDLFEIDNAVYVLNPACQLIHTVIHGLQYAPESSIRWITDAAYLLRDHMDAIDWQQLLSICQEYHLNLPLKMALIYLREELNQPVPDHIISYFKNVKITKRDDEYFDASSHLSFRQRMRRMFRIWHHYKKYSEHAGRGQQPVSFLDFLAIYTNQPSRWALLPYVFMRFVVLSKKALTVPMRWISKSDKTGE